MAGLITGLIAEAIAGPIIQVKTRTMTGTMMPPMTSMVICPIAGYTIPQIRRGGMGEC
jgi:hypothetical protein